MRYLFALASLMAISTPVQAETVYLLIKSEMNYKYGGGLAVHSIPMPSAEKCEEAGALLISSERFDTKYANRDGFECIIGK